MSIRFRMFRLNLSPVPISSSLPFAAIPNISILPLSPPFSKHPNDRSANTPLSLPRLLCIGSLASSDYCSDQSAYSTIKCKRRIRPIGPRSLWVVTPFLIVSSTVCFIIWKTSLRGTRDFVVDKDAFIKRRGVIASRVSLLLLLLPCFFPDLFDGSPDVLMYLYSVETPKGWRVFTRGRLKYVNR